MAISAYMHLPIFKGLTAHQVEQLRPLLDLQSFSQDQVIFKQKQVTFYLYILVSGEVSIVYEPEDGPPWTITRLLPGSVFGWSAAVGHAYYTSSAISLTESRAFCITGKGLQRIFEQYPDTGVIFLDNLASGIAVRMNSTRIKALAILTQNWIGSNAAYSQ
jgi:CRP-like cAMP-binding protein